MLIVERCVALAAEVVEVGVAFLERHSRLWVWRRLIVRELEVLGPSVIWLHADAHVEVNEPLVPVARSGEWRATMPRWIVNLGRLPRRR